MRGQRIVVDIKRPPDAPVLIGTRAVVLHGAEGLEHISPAPPLISLLLPLLEILTGSPDVNHGVDGA